MAKYTYNDLFSPDIEKGIEDLNKKILNLHEDLIKISNIKLDIVGGENLQKIQSQQEKLIELKKQEKTIDEATIKIKNHLNEEEKKALSARKKAEREAEKFNSEKIKENAISQEYRKNLKKEITTQLELEKIQRKEVKSLNDMKRAVVALKNKRDALDLTNKESIKEYNKLNNKILEYNNRVKKADYQVGFFQRNVGNYKSALSGLGTAFTGVSMAVMGITMAVKGAFDIMEKYTKKFEMQKTAEEKLSSIMKSNAHATDAQVQSIIKLTAAQQKLGVVGDEIQIAGAQQLAMSTKNTKSLKILIPALNNFIVQQKGVNATQQDAVTYGKLFGQVLSGNIGSLSRYGIVLTKTQKKLFQTGTELQKATLLEKLITQKTGDMNAMFAKTDTGKIQQAKNRIGDLQEKIGGKLMPVLAQLYASFSKILDLLIKSGIFKELSQDLQYLTILLTKFNDVLGKTNGKSFFWKTFAQSIKNTLNPLGQLKKNLTGLLKLLGLYHEKTKKLEKTSFFKIQMNKDFDKQMQDIIQKVNDNVDKSNKKILSFEESQAEEYLRKKLELTKRYKNDEEKINLKLAIFKKEQLEEYSKYLSKNEKKNKDKIIENQLAIFETEKNIATQRKQIEDEIYQKKLENFNKSQAEEKANNDAIIISMKKAGVSEVKIKKETILLKEDLLKKYLVFLNENGKERNKIEIKQTENMLADLNLQLNNFDKKQDKGKDKTSFLQKIIGGTNSNIAKGVENVLNSAFNYIQNYYNKVNAKIDEQINKHKELQNTYQEDINKINESLKTEEESINKKIALGVAYDRTKENSLKKELLNKQKSLEAEKKLEAKAVEERKKVEEKQKIMDITRATISTAKAVVEALGTPPAPNFVLAGLAGIAGALQIATIKNQKFAEGTEFVKLEGNPKGTDTIPAFVNEGERILTKEQNNIIPNNFPNKLIPLAVNNFLNTKNNKQKENNIKENDKSLLFLEQIAKNTESEKIYKNGILVEENYNNLKITYC